MKANKVLNKIIAIIGLILLIVVILLNIIFKSQLSNDIVEHVQIVKTGIFSLLITIFVAIGIYFLSKYITDHIKLKKSWSKYIIIGIILIIYMVAQIVWIRYRNASPGVDQQAVYSLATNLYNGNKDELMHSNYLEKCPHQITLMFIENTIFTIFKSKNVRILQYINVIGNALTLVALLLILKQLSKKYKVNKPLCIILISTFIALTLLSTFVYGDIFSLALALFSIYFIMNYSEKNQKRYLIISAIFLAFSYMLRMNNLIFIIAISIYLILDILKSKNEIIENSEEKLKNNFNSNSTKSLNYKVNEKQIVEQNKKEIAKQNDSKNIKAIIIKILLILLFIIITILPATIIKMYYQNKFELSKENAIPTSTYIYMGMTDGYRQSGWYNDYGAWAWTNETKVADEMYKTAIKERIGFLATNPKELVKFYTKKTASMWAENTYGSLYFNESFNFELEENQDKEKDQWLINKEDKIVMYEKALIILIFLCSIITILQNKKDLSNDLTLLILIFIGGFLFETLWEAKSRYIIPYIIVLIPVASIYINNIKFT